MAQMTRTSTFMVLVPPTRSNSRSCSTRSSFAWNASGHVADLVEKQRAAVGQLEAARAVRDGAGEGALLVAEQLRLEQRLRQRGAVDLDERLAARARRAVVHRARHSSLPVPLSPRRSTVEFDLATMAMVSSTSMIAGLSPTMPATSGRSRRFSFGMHETSAFSSVRPRQQPLPVGRKHPVQLHCLTDQIGDHHEEPDVEIQAEGGMRIKGAVDRERADDLEADCGSARR